MSVRIIVTGCRDWEDTHRISKELEHELERFFYYQMDGPEITIVHGNSGNVDDAANSFAVHRGLEQEFHPADWDTHGKAAGPIRNREMAQADADICLAFWDGKSKGTLDMITQAVRHGIPVRIVPKEGKCDERK